MFLVILVAKVDPNEDAADQHHHKHHVVGPVEPLQRSAQVVHTLMAIARSVRVRWDRCRIGRNRRRHDAWLWIVSSAEESAENR